MEENIYPFINTKRSKIIFLLSIITAIFLIIGLTINVYSNAFVGAVFELIWITVLLSVLVLPILSFIYLIRSKFNFKSLYLYSIIVIIVAVLAVSLINS